MLQPKIKGDTALGAAIKYFLSSGYEVLLPIGDKRDYDIVVEKNNIMSRVQVKFGGLYKGRTTCKVALRVMGGNQSFFTVKRYDKCSFDFLFVLTAKNSTYLIPWEGNIIKQSTLNIEAVKYDSFKVTLQGWWSGQSHLTVNQTAYAYGGSNPSPCTIQKTSTYIEVFCMWRQVDEYASAN